MSIVRGANDSRAQA